MGPLFLRPSTGLRISDKWPAFIYDAVPNSTLPGIVLMRRRQQVYIALRGREDSWKATTSPVPMAAGDAHKTLNDGQDPLGSPCS